MAKLKIGGKISKRHLIALLEDRIEQLERRVEDLERTCRPIWYVSPFGTDKTKSPPYEVTITSLGSSART